MAIHLGFFDESGKYQRDPVVSFSGVCSSRGRLGNFEEEWEVLLGAYGLRSLHMARCSRLEEGCGPKMPKGQSIEERINALYPFADCINRYLEIGLMQCFDTKAWVRLKMDVRKKLGGSPDPYYIAFVLSMLEVKRHIHEDDRVSIIVDDDMVTAWDCYVHYRAVQDDHAYPELRKTLVSLAFANDEYHKALQASDLVAYLARRVAEEKFYGKHNEFNRLFEYLTQASNPSGSVMNWQISFAGEQELVDYAIQMDELDEERRRVQEFRRANAKLIKVPHGEIKAQLEAEKQQKRKAKKPSASEDRTSGAKD
ncbi:MAG TPA: DUF3800 domain-containing protein [Candidatus Sulfotelmatobacter sp.]|nr:DUF3800 domain-containing protein [Candidatus Sulfotelmatobacter sp.]